jgi:transposase
VNWPEEVEAMALPPYSPELNPVERYFQELRAKLSNKVFETIEEIMEALSEALAPYWDNPSMLASLTGYGWWLCSFQTCRHHVSKLRLL